MLEGGAAVLFDLDGTLADTAPDLAGALNRLLEEEGRAALPLPTLRPHVSAGARGLIEAGFARHPGDDDFPRLTRRFLEHYAAALCVASELFAGVPAMLDALERRGIRWGIVTNKAQRFALPLSEQLGLRRRAACIVSGDTALRPKPHPAPLLLGCAALQLSPASVAYVGDDLRDIVAGRAAGLRTVTAAYGYLGGEQHYATWQADAVIYAPEELLELLGGRT